MAKARDWLAGLLEDLGITEVTETPSRGSPRSDSLQVPPVKKTWTIHPSVLKELDELVRIIEEEKMLTGPNESYTVTLAIHEMYLNRTGKKS